MKVLFTACLLMSAFTGVLGQQSRFKAGPVPVYLTYDEAKTVIDSFEDDIPEELRKPAGPEQRAAWNKWIRQKDQAIRSRLAQGDEDSLINLLLFGTSFTKQPRISFAQIQKGDESLYGVLQTRLDDFISALDEPMRNERLIFARQVLIEQRGFKTTPEIERDRLKLFLLTGLQRVFQENDKYKQIIDSARMQNDPTFEFAERSKLFNTRGLSSDTLAQPNFAIEVALKELKAKGEIKPGSVIRIGIVGPGLDFADKEEGYDFYPLQTIQPFALMDSLVKLGLADKAKMRVTTLDISPRINLHIRNLQQSASKGKSYVVWLARDKSVSWTPEFLSFWNMIGNQIGRRKNVSRVPEFADLRVVEIDSAIAAKVSPAEVNIILQNIKTAPSEQFDLIIATNILVYYNSFEQSLAMLNIEKMLRPGGIFLSNNAVLERRDSNIRSIGFTSARYSLRGDDGDTIVWYQRKRN